MGLSKTIVVRVSPDVYEAIKRSADKDGRTLSNYARAVLSKQIHNPKGLSL